MFRPVLNTQGARKCIDNEDVFGNRISVNFPTNSNNVTNNECGAGRNISPQKQGNKTVHGYSSSPDQSRKTSHNDSTSSKGQVQKSSFPAPPNATSLQQNQASRSVASTDSFQFSRHWDANPSLQSTYSMDGGQSEVFAEPLERPYGAYEMNDTGQQNFGAGERTSGLGLAGSGQSFMENLSDSAGHDMISENCLKSSSTPSSQHYYLAGSTSSQQTAYIAGSSHSNKPVDLRITNLDQSVDPKEIKRFLRAIFVDHVTVLHVSVNLRPNGSRTAGIKVPSIQDAKLAISKLQSSRLGSKLILISVVNPNDGPPRNEVCALDVPSNNLYKKRYPRNSGVSKFHKLHDVVSVQENSNDRIVSLNAGVRNIPSPAFSEGSKEVQEILELAHCKIQDEGKGCAEKEQLPNVIISLKLLTPNVHSLLRLHDNSIPLNSFLILYEREFGKLNTVQEDGASLEHLVTCVPGVHIVMGNNRIKMLEWIDEKTSKQPKMCHIRPQFLDLFWEIEELLKNQPYCSMPISRFVPMYQNHFEKQFSAVDYGQTKLMCLLESLPHVVQIIGEGLQRLLTLTHRVQIKRFTADLLRILKSQASKRIALSRFSDIYLMVIGKDFNVINYGVCDISDLLSDVSEKSVVITKSGSHTIVSILKREQTIEEVDCAKQFSSEAVELLSARPHCSMALTKFMRVYQKHGFMKLIKLFKTIPETVEVQFVRDENEKILQLTPPVMLQVLQARTIQFSSEVVELLRFCPRYCMAFAKFVPAYHQHFGKQCYVSNYGFNKFIKLFEVIPETVRLLREENEKIIQLTQPVMLQVFANQISMMLAPRRPILTVDNMLSTFIQMHGYSLCPEDFGARNVRELINKISHVVKVVETFSGPILTAVDRYNVLHQSICARRILLDHPAGKMGMNDFLRSFKSRYGHDCDLSRLCNDAKKFKVEGNCSYKTISVNPIQLLMKDVVLLLEENEGKLPVSQFATMFSTRFQRQFNPNAYGYSSTLALLVSMQEVVAVSQTRSRKRMVCLNEVGPCYLALFKSAKIVQSSQNPEEACLQPPLSLPLPQMSCNRTTLNLMSDPIPSRIQSSGLRSLLVPSGSEPISFGATSSDFLDDFAYKPTSMHHQQTLQLSNVMDGYPESTYYSMPFETTSPYFPLPSMVPPLPDTSIYLALPSTENHGVPPPAMYMAPN